MIISHTWLRHRDTHEPNTETLFLQAHVFCYHDYSGLILGLRPANERWRYKVRLSVIGWVQTQNQPWLFYLGLSTTARYTTMVSGILANAAMFLVAPKHHPKHLSHYQAIDSHPKAFSLSAA